MSRVCQENRRHSTVSKIRKRNIVEYIMGDLQILDALVTVHTTIGCFRKRSIDNVLIS